MDVSMRQWPIFMTGLLLGAAGTMALGLHRATEAEMAAVAAKAAPATTAVIAAPAEIAPDPRIAEQRAEEQMRAAVETFRSQEILASASLAPPKPRARRPIAAPAAVDPPVALAPDTAPGPVEPARSDTSVMGAAPMPQRVEAARGSAHAAEEASP